MVRKRKRHLLLLVVLLFAALLIVFTFYENHHVLVRTVDITLPDLPKAFDGFSILQISDLHGESFGTHQADLLNLIHQTPHDILVFTGDMNPDYNADVCAAVQDLITGLQGETMFWVDGNCGPYAVYSAYGVPSGQLTPSGVMLTQMGVQILTEPVPIMRNGDCIFLTPKFSLSQIQDNLRVGNRIMHIEGLNWSAMADYYARLQRWYIHLTEQDHTIIAIAHFPEQSYLSELAAQTNPLPYDLMICGHTHGGQIRLPIIGAIYIPSASTDHGGWFPAEKDTRGLSRVNDVLQYISAGLGASHRIPFLAFRFNCPPEINQIILHCANPAESGEENLPRSSE